LGVGDWQQNIRGQINWEISDNDRIVRQAQGTYWYIRMRSSSLKTLAVKESQLANLREKSHNAQTIWPTIYIHGNRTAPKLSLWVYESVASSTDS
jgi:hypothetical protein